jgi:hypothetical protein
MTLRAPKRTGGRADVVMLRPAAWLAERQVRPGGRVDIEVPECGIEGLAGVLAVEPCPPIASGPGPRGHRHVPPPGGRHRRRPHRRRRRADRHDAEPSVLERDGTGVRPRRPPPAPASKSARSRGSPRSSRSPNAAPPEPVFNLEVQLDHVYHVADSGARA